jgi:hypothetical protein
VIVERIKKVIEALKDREESEIAEAIVNNILSEIN